MIIYNYLSCVKTTVKHFMLRFHEKLVENSKNVILCVITKIQFRIHLCVIRTYFQCIKMKKIILKTESLCKFNLHRRNLTTLDVVAVEFIWKNF